MAANNLRHFAISCERSPRLIKTADRNLVETATRQRRCSRGGAICTRSSLHYLPPQLPDKIAIMRPVRQFVDSFNRSDLKTACAAQSAIIDEFPPYLWQGATACADWSNDFDAFREKNGIVDPKNNIGIGPACRCHGRSCLCRGPSAPHLQAE